MSNLLKVTMKSDLCAKV